MENFFTILLPPDFFCSGMIPICKKSFQLPEMTRKKKNFPCPIFLLSDQSP